MGETTALAKRLEAYPALQPQAKTLELMSENMGGGLTTAFDLERVKIPTGGAAQFTVPGLTGDTTCATIEGVVALYQDCRAYWKEAFSGDMPPDCSSEDGIRGVGEPGGICAKCPMASWGSSAKGGNGQACKQIRRLFLLQAGSHLPVLLSLPPTSIKPCRQYMTRITNAGLPYWSVVTVIGLEKAKNKEGIAYAKAAFACAKDGDAPAILPDDQAQRVKAFGAALRQAIKHVFTQEEFVIGGENGNGDHE